MQLKTLDDLTALEKLSLTQLSYSRLDTYLQCPAKYFYSYIQKVPRTSSPAADLGSLLHQVLEDCCGDTLDLEEMIFVFNDKLPEFDSTGNISDQQIEDGKTMLMEFFDRHKDDHPAIIAKEGEFDIIVGNGTIKGFIDRIDLKPDGTINVVDYKSGKKVIAGKPEDNLQMGIYALAVSQTYPNHKIYAELYYLRTGKRKGAIFGEEQHQKTVEFIDKSLFKLRNEENFPHTDKVSNCYWCDHKTSGVCPVGVYRTKR